jgi:hypothetical protein
MDTIFMEVQAKVLEGRVDVESVVGRHCPRKSGHEKKGRNQGSVTRRDRLKAKGAC